MTAGAICTVCSGPLPHGRHVCCSPKCWQDRRIAGLTRQCGHCGTPFVARPDQAGAARRRGRPTYCSSRCGSRHKVIHGFSTKEVLTTISGVMKNRKLILQLEKAIQDVQRH